MLSVLSIFFVSDNVQALSFNFNGKETEVTEENFIYYCYFYVGDDLFKYEYITAFLHSNGQYVCITSDIKYAHPDNSNQLYFDFTNNHNDYRFDSNFNYLKSTIRNNYSATYFTFSKVLFSNYDILNRNQEIYFSKNFTYDDLKNGGVVSTYKITYYLNNEIYRVFEVEKGSSHTLEDYSFNKDLYVFSGWSVDDNKDLSNITSDISIRATLEEKQVNAVYVKNFNDFPITRTDFYALLVLLATLIIFLFLRWCFPMKGGRNL